MPKEVVIIGGGIAGLIAATELADSFQVKLLEAKDRFGGRVHSIHPDGNVVELGAEFVHGESLNLLTAIHAANLKVQPASDRNQFHQGASLHMVDIWEKFGDLTKRIPTGEADQSFLSFANEIEMPRKEREMMLAFAAGFNAADPARISAHSLRRADYSSAQMNGEKQSRIQAGYGSLVDALENDARRRKATLLTNVRAKTVEWKRGHVQVTAESENMTETFQADAAIITLPLGVLKAGSVTFKPSLLHKQEAIDNLEFGNVVKITLVFRDHWWPGGDFGFIHSLDEPLQTWWSDPRGPVLTGWAAGPKADILLNYLPSDLELLAVQTLSRIFSTPAEKIRSRLVSAHTHNWWSDPHVRGAYSYIPVGGLIFPKVLGAPMEETLFFAGEATAQDAQLGTVFAALESGQRAAQEIKHAL